MISLVCGLSCTSTNLLPFSLLLLVLLLPLLLRTCWWGCSTCHVFKIHDLVPFVQTIECAAGTYKCRMVFKGVVCIISKGVDNASACRHIRCRLGYLHFRKMLTNNYYLMLLVSFMLQICYLFKVAGVSILCTRSIAALSHSG